MDLKAHPGATALAFAIASVATPALAQTAEPSADGFWAAVNPAIGTGLGWIETAAITLAAGQVFRWTGIQITQALQDRIHRAADTGLHAALAGIERSIDRGLSGTGRLQVLAKAVTYVKTYVPRALATLGITPEQLESVVLSKLAKVEIAGVAPRAAGLADPAMARGDGPDRT